MNHGGAYHEQQRTGIALTFLWPLLFGLIWICMIFLANPIGNFPLNDDWAYAYSVQHFLQHTELRFSDWTGPNLFGSGLNQTGLMRRKNYRLDHNAPVECKVLCT